VLNEFTLDSSIASQDSLQNITQALGWLTDAEDRLFAIALISLHAFKHKYGSWPVTNRVSDMKSNTQY